MPTYDYHCRACEHRFEHFQGMTSRVLRKCPECGERKLRRLIGSGAGVIFKGSGFYETDYKRGRKGGKSSEKDSAASESKSDDAKGSGKASDAADTKKGGKDAKPPSPKKDGKPGRGSQSD